MAFNIFKIIAFISNWSPVLHISEDSNFGSVDKLSRVRLSFLAIPLGKNKFYFLSLVKDEVINKWKLEIYKCLNFYSVCKKEDQSQIDTKVNSYNAQIGNQLDIDNLKIQIDFLKDKFNQNQERKSILYNKINNYTAIVLVFLGFIGYLLTELLNLNFYKINYYIYWIMFVLLIIYTLNLSLFVKDGLSIQAYIRSKFGDLKNNPTYKQLALSYYTDWYSSKNESQILSSIVCNIEEYFSRSLFITILLWFCIIINKNWPSMAYSTTLNYKSEYLIVNNSDEFLPDEFSKFLKNINKTKNGIYIISNKDNFNYKVIKEFIEIATKKSSRLEAIEIESNSLDNNTILLKYKD